VVLLGTHYDTKRIPGVRFVGANDGASGTALLLEVARQLATYPLPFDIWLVFFDGEEAFGRDITRDDGLYGSRSLAGQMESDGTLERVAAMIVVDMVADADLNLAVDLNSSPALRRVLRDSAERLGMASLIDASVPLRVTDDHTPFLRRGVSEVLAVIDFQYGARSSPGPLWHTSGDDLDKVSAESLNSAGRLLVETLHGVERRLVEAERARDR
jgi:Zn-dependent M28 family amino/carboxypeptidase